MQQVRDPFARRVRAKRADDRASHAGVNGDTLRPRPDVLHRQVIAQDRPFGEHVRHTGDEAECQQQHREALRQFSQIQDRGIDFFNPDTLLHKDALSKANAGS